MSQTLFDEDVIVGAVSESAIRIITCVVHFLDDTLH